ncbi:MAG: valine--pyruvate transaminase [Cellvibrionaceae bacterium]
MKLSKFGNKFTGESATVSLMDDLGDALLVNPNLLFMGGGNPSRIARAEAVYRDALQSIIHDEDTLHKMLGVYQPPQGDPQFLQGLSALLNKEFNWGLSEKNIAISNGSQSAFSVLFNLFSGEQSDGSHKTVHLPLVPEYIGYSDIGFSEAFYTSTQPAIELLDHQLFKYHVDFDHLSIDDSVGLLCVSRPTNPTGNVLTDDEVSRLATMAKKNDIPFVIDGAYGTPFPNIIFTDANPVWDEHVVLVLSLSKLGIPGARTGIVIANEQIIDAFTKANTVLSLACGNMGPYIGKELIKNNTLLSLSNDVIQPFYKDASEKALLWMRELFTGFNYRVHRPEGAIFLWIWFEGLPITSKALYDRLKKKGLLVLAGEDFFIGVDEQWHHQYECLRVTYCQKPEVVYKGLQMIAEEVRSLF